MATRLSDIAEKTGLAIPTVSEVLNGKPGRAYKEETRRRVIAAAQELGYRVNSSARAIRAGKFSAIGLVFSTHGASRSWATHAVMMAIEAALRERNYQMVVGAFDDTQLSEDRGVSRVLRELMVDGVLLNYNYRTPSQLINFVESSRLPFVWLNTLRNQDCIYVDNSGGVAHATEWLIQNGHRRIAYLSPQPKGDEFDQAHYTVRERFSGYLSAMSRENLSTMVVPLEPGTSREHPLHQLLTAPDRPTALLCHHIELAYQALCLAARAGLSVPEDLSIVTLSPETAEPVPQALTRIIVHEKERAAAAVDAILQKIEEPEKSVAPRIVRMHMIDPTASVRPIS